MLDLPDYNEASLCWRETRIVYLHGELVIEEREREFREQGMGLEQIARALSKLRSELRSWTRTLMSDRREAARLDTGDPNPTFEELVAKCQSKYKLTGDAVYKHIIKSASASRASVNKMLKLPPENPPPLPPLLPSSPTDAAPCPNGSGCCLPTITA